MKEGRIRTIKEICKRRLCEKCGEPATHKLTFLLPNARANPASSAYRHDDCSWCSDKAMFVCDSHERERWTIAEELGMEWCAAFPFNKRHEHMFLYWEVIVPLIEEKDANRDRLCV